MEGLVKSISVVLFGSSVSVSVVHLQDLGVAARCLVEYVVVKVNVVFPLY